MQNTGVKLDIRGLHIYYLTWRLPISGAHATGVRQRGAVSKSRFLPSLLVIIMD
jgi:hypothetical protein